MGAHVFDSEEPTFPGHVGVRNRALISSHFTHQTKDKVELVAEGCHMVIAVGLHKPRIAQRHYVVLFVRCVRESQHYRRTATVPHENAEIVFQDMAVKELLELFDDTRECRHTYSDYNIVHPLRSVVQVAAPHVEYPLTWTDTKQERLILRIPHHNPLPGGEGRIRSGL